MKKLLAILLLGCGHQVSYTLVPAHEFTNSYGMAERTYNVIARGDNITACRETALKAAYGVCGRMGKAWYIVDTKEEQAPKEAVFQMEFGCVKQ